MAEVEPIKETLDAKTDILINKSDSAKDQKVKNGGAREGSGRPKGAPNKKTLEQKTVNEHFRQRVLKNADKLFNAQLQLATGEQVLMVRVKEKDSKGKILRTYTEQITSPSVIQEFLDDNDGMPTDMGYDDNWYYISTKPANNQALESLLNRGLGKAPDKIEVEGGFFNQDKLIIKVVGSKHDDIEFGSDGQITEPGNDDPGDDPVGETGSSDTPPGTSTGS